MKGKPSVLYSNFSSHQSAPIHALAHFSLMSYEEGKNYERKGELAQKNDDDFFDVNVHPRHASTLLKHPDNTLSIFQPDAAATMAHHLWQKKGTNALQKWIHNQIFKDEVTPHKKAFNIDDFSFSLLRERDPQKVALIIGGAGFIGCHLAEHLLKNNEKVVIYDNLSRPGSEHNLERLCQLYGSDIQLEIADIRDATAIKKAILNASKIFHVADQSNRISSLQEPQKDFDVNVTGTLNILEVLRSMRSPPPLIFVSSYKVYGALDEVVLHRIGKRYQPQEPRHQSGITEDQALDFLDPYSCSKGVADEYVLKYARTYNIPTVVLRVGDVYGAYQTTSGPHQCFMQDSDSITQMLTQCLTGHPVQLRGDGYQVRDYLFIDDVIHALLLAHEKIQALSGRAFNIGGGMHNSASQWELLAHIERVTGIACKADIAEKAFNPPLYYVSQFRRFTALTGWYPRHDLESGLIRLQQWIETQSLDHEDRYYRAQSSALLTDIGVFSNAQVL